MRALVIGAGGMGRAVAWDLARQPGTTAIRLIDRNPKNLVLAERELARLLSSGERRVHIEAECCDLAATPPLGRLFAGVDVAVGAADYRYNELLTRAAIDGRAHFCDLGGNNDIVRAQLALSDAAQRQGVTVVPDCGLAPGLAGMIAAHGLERLGTADSIRLRVGGLPPTPKPPLGYKLVFSVRGLINEYLEPTEVLRDGEVLSVPSLSELETLEFPPPFGRMEAFNTSGGASTLPYTLRDRVRSLDYKTVRYPGHCVVMAALRDLGFFSEQAWAGSEPRAFTERLLERALSDEDEADVVLLRVTLERQDGPRKVCLSYDLVDHFDASTGHSAMARTTGYSAATVAYMLGAGAISRRGVLPGELALPLEPYLVAVRARGLQIHERWDGSE